jgi:transposase, IS5 family
VIGLLLLKHMFGLSDEGVCARWIYDPYFQHFTGKTFFQHTFPHERSDLSHWRTPSFSMPRSRASITWPAATACD